MDGINGLEQWQKDALMFWIQDMADEIWKLKCIYGKDGLSMENIPQHLLTQETRRESHEAAKADAAARRRVILEILTENKNGMTAREVAGELHRRGITPTDERNYAAPRLTELYKAGEIEVTGKKQCPQTGRNVAVWEIPGVI